MNQRTNNRNFSSIPVEQRLFGRMNERTIERLNERTMNDRTNYEQVDERSNERPNDPCACVGMGVRGDK
jgi:hypothetical protein